MNKENTGYRETFRPQYHFSPQSNWLNDPDGLVYYEGEYHLFYQYNPYSSAWGSIHWGHAVSQDLLHWKSLPIALRPDELGEIFSGSVVVDKEGTSGLFDGGSGLVAIYTNAYKRGDDDYLQRQSIAYSGNGGRSWHKYGGNPVIENPGVDAFRDPNVFWYDPDDRWIMVLTYDSQVRFYGSKNLREWRLLSQFGEGFGSHEGSWECPDLLRFDLGDGREKWVLEVGDMNGGEADGSRVQYFVGDFDGKEFLPDSPSTEPLWLDYGQDFYASRSWNNLPENRHVSISWLNNLKYSEKIPSQGWRGAMSIPRELSLTNTPGELRLTQKPIREVEKLRAKSVSYKDLKIGPTSNFSPDISSDSLEIVAEAAPKTGKEFGFKLRKQGSEETVIGYDMAEGKLFVNRANSGSTDFSKHFLDINSTTLEPVNEKIRIRIFLDRSTVEVFGNHGAGTISCQIFPEHDGKEVQLYAEEGNIEVTSLQVHELKSTLR